MGSHAWRADELRGEEMSGHFTIARFAEVLDEHPRQIRRRMEGSAPTGTAIVAGKEVKAWNVAAIPAALKLRLESFRQASTFRSIEEMLSNRIAELRECGAFAFSKFEPALPLSEIHQESLDRAAKLREALRPAIELRNNRSLSAAELEEIGLRNYNRAFGERQSIQARAWRRLFKRTLQRAGASTDFERLEFYLEENPRRRKSSPSINKSAASQFPHVREIIERFLLSEEREQIKKTNLWAYLFEWYHIEVVSGSASREFKRALISLLFLNLPCLAKTEQALRRNFDLKYAEWIESGVVALIDGRCEREIKQPDQQEVLKIVKQAAFCRQPVRMATRQVKKRGEFKPETEAQLNNQGSKSRLPKKISRMAVCLSQSIAPNVQGSRAVQMAMPPTPRSYDEVQFVCDQFQGDDATMNNWFYHQTESGFEVTRGQWLVCVDTRSRRVLSHCLIADAQYRARNIRTLFTRTFGSYGFCNQLYWERGIWRRSEILTGGARAKFANSEEKIDIGLRRFGIDIKHALRPQAKIIEGIIKALQSYTGGDKGWCGSNERKTRPEILAEQFRKIKNGAHPGEFLYSFGEWHARLGQIADEYNSECQEGKMLRGLSPDEGFVEFQNHENPPERWDSSEPRYASLRCLLAHGVKQKVQIGPDGIKFKMGKELLYFYDAEAGKRKFQYVDVFYDIDDLSYVAVQDEFTREPFIVKRAEQIPAYNAGKEEMQHAMKQRQDFMAAPKALYDILKNPIANTRPIVADEASIAFADTIERHKAQEQKRKAAAAAKSRKVEMLAVNGIPPELARNNPQGWEGICDLLEHGGSQSQKEKAE